MDNLSIVFVFNYRRRILGILKSGSSCFYEFIVLFVSVQKAYRPALFQHNDYSINK